MEPQDEEEPQSLVSSFIKEFSGLKDKLKARPAAAVRFPLFPAEGTPQRGVFAAIGCRWWW